MDALAHQHEDRDVVVISVRMMGAGGPEYLSAEEHSFSEHEQMLFTKAVRWPRASARRSPCWWFRRATSLPRWCRAPTRWRWIRSSPASPAHMTAEDQAFHMGQAWEALPEPKRQFNFYVVDPDGEVKVFYIGPHAPNAEPG